MTAWHIPFQIVPYARQLSCLIIRHLTVSWHSVARLSIFKALLAYRVGQKVTPKYSTHNFVKYTGRFLKILSLLHSPGDLQ